MVTKSLGHLELYSYMYGSTGNLFILGVCKGHCPGPLPVAPSLLSPSSLNVCFKLSGDKDYNFVTYVNHTKSSEVLLHI